MSPPTAGHANLKVFLVEDNPDTRLMLAQVLEIDGFDVRTAGTMHAALQEFPIFGGEVLLTDLGLPDGDGWELLRQLQRAGSLPFAIAMSGFGTLSDIAASKAAGFRHHLVKPFELDALGHLLEEARLEIEGAHRTA